MATRKSITDQKTNHSMSENNVGTVGMVGFQAKEGKGSFKKMEKLAEEKLADKKRIEKRGLGENEEDHTTKL